MYFYSVTNMKPEKKVLQYHSTSFQSYGILLKTKARIKSYFFSKCCCVVKKVGKIKQHILSTAQDNVMKTFYFKNNYKANTTISFTRLIQMACVICLVKFYAIDITLS